MRESLPGYAAEALFSVLNFEGGAPSASVQAAVSVRFHPLKRVPCLEDEDLRAVPWCKDAFFLGQRAAFTMDPAFHAGAYYVQDSSSMFLDMVKGHILDAVSDCGTALDLCASPGGKSTHLISLLGADAPRLTVCNEAVGKRVPQLCDNIAKWGAANVVVTNSSAAQIGRLEGFFDVVLADVPCSGEGMFRKSSDAAELWSPKTVQDCAALQRSIISDIWPALREGGLLIYSTCTYNHLENQDNVKYIAEHLGAEYIALDSEADLPEGLVKLPWGCQFVPGLVPGEGQFFALLRKKPSEEGSRTVRRKGGQPRLSLTFDPDFGACFAKSHKADEVFMLPACKDLAANMLCVYDNLNTKMLGCRVGRLKGETLVPDADFALSCALAAGDKTEVKVSNPVLDVCFACVEVDTQTALRFLCKENITPQPSWPQGYILLKYKSLGLGFLKNLGTRCNNLHPLMRRIVSRPR